MICPITNRECKTNGCGEKCYKKDTLDSKNQITITRCKESWNREEITELFEKFVDQKYPLLYPFLKENL